MADHSSSSNEKNGPHRTAIIVAVVGAVALVAAAIVTGLFGLIGGDSSKSKNATITSRGDNNASGCVNGPVIIQDSDVNCPGKPGGGKARPAKSPLTTADAGCGTIGGKPSERSLRLKVIMWCAPRAVRGQYEYKLKLNVTNTGHRPLDIRRERFVLLWRTMNPHRWSPPANGAPSAPRKVSWQSRDYWAIFANPDGAFEANGNVGGFTTHWTYTTLAPGEDSLRPRKGSPYIQFEDKDGALKKVHFNFHEDDLVFYVPVSTVNRDRNFLGLGYFDGKRILAVCPQKKWGPKVPPSAF